MLDDYRKLPKLQGLSTPMSAAVYDAVRNGHHIHHYRSRTAAALIKRGYFYQDNGISHYSYPTDKAKKAVEAVRKEGGGQ
ncbi:hypothetical protein [Terasakiella sp.]|uniref:hypothetical protein n=1 Tax=Terasakiella sp. TaxID=2034861 RepID=UPI003AA838A9